MSPLKLAEKVSMELDESLNNSLSALTKHFLLRKEHISSCGYILEELHTQT